MGQFNTLCGKIREHIATGGAPRGARAPETIGREGLFKLDVDDAIWQDVGLEDDDGGPMPLWLGDEKAREGIRRLLEYDRCQEELRRLRRERQSMQEWAIEEWGRLQRAREEGT